MKEVIEHGYGRYKTTCTVCRCRFTYELEDIEKGYVLCPDCRNTCWHSSINLDFTSQLNGDENK